ncbi:MAG: B12-binding domain-containing protein [Paracoccaceae bacterium]
MKKETTRVQSDMVPEASSQIRFLAESALRVLAESRQGELPSTRDGWVERLCRALMSDSETSHHRTISMMIANGIPSIDIVERYIPAVARRLGELWVKDDVSFVDVTLAAGRLQGLVRARADIGAVSPARTIPMGQAVLIVLPEFEDHTLGAFVAADQFRRHGQWVHMAIGLSPSELLNEISEREFAMVGFTCGSEKSVDLMAELIDYLRTNGGNLPPLVLGGYAVHLIGDLAQRVGVDHAVGSTREAVERCGLATVAESLSID